MNKQSAFNRFFREPVSLSGLGYALSAELYPTAAEAAVIFSEYTSEDVRPERLVGDRVRYSLPPEDIDWDGPPGNIWWAGASGKGSKPIWWYGE